MTTISLQCVDVEQRDGYSLVNLQYTSTDSTIYAGGSLTFTIGDASGFEVGKYYDLNLKEVA